jgi:hypothetical protein
MAGSWASYDLAEYGGLIESVSETQHVLNV